MQILAADHEAAPLAVRDLGHDPAAVKESGVTRGAGVEIVRHGK